MLSSRYSDGQNLQWMLKKRLGRYLKGLALVLFFMSLVGCVSSQRSLYYWGAYESLIYDMYFKPGSAPPSKQITLLNEAIEQAEAIGKPIAPGIYAHLGFMYAIDNQAAASKAAFQQEMALYPESRVLIQGMMERAAQVQHAAIQHKDSQHKKRQHKENKRHMRVENNAQ